MDLASLNRILIVLLWIVAILGNAVMKKIQPESTKLYFFYSIGIALTITAFAVLCKRL